MCANREHRYRLQLKIRGQEEFDLVVYAHHVSEAVSIADGYAHEKYPGMMVNFSISHMGYSSDVVAQEHGAKLSSLEDHFRRRGIPVEVVEARWEQEEG
jgi:hypothetical protein